MMYDKLKQLFFVSRPISWVNTAYPFAATYLVAGGLELSIFLVLATIFFLIPYNLLMYGINDVFDYESDIRNPRKGSIEGAITPRTMHSLIIKSSLFLSLPFLLYMFMSGTVISNIILVFSLFFVVAYSAKYLRFKERPFLDSLTSSIHFMSPMLYALSLTSFSKNGLIAVVAFTCWGMASHAFGAVQDVLPDRKAKISSIATVIGAKPTVRLALVLYIIALSFVLFIEAWDYKFIFAFTGLLYVFNILPYITISDDESSATNKAWRRFIWINLIVGAVLTILLIVSSKN